MGALQAMATHLQPHKQAHTHTHTGRHSPNDDLWPRRRLFIIIFIIINN